jgi:hypothetical protein
MDLPIFSDSEFLDQNVLNAAFNLSYTSAKQITTLTNSFGVINPSSLTFTPSALTVTVAAPSPFAVLFIGGVLTGAHGTTNGADTSTYVVNMAPFVPTSGTVTVYIVAIWSQIQESPYEVVGPPSGHPDFNPSFAAYQAYAEIKDTLSIFATTTPPDGNHIELCRTTLTVGQTSITSVDTTHWVYASSLLGNTGVTPGAYPGANVTVGADGRITSIVSGFTRIIGGSPPNSYIYDKFPDGTIIQAYTGINPTGSDFITFPNAFPNTCIQVVAIEGAPAGWSAGSQPTIFGTQQINATQFALYATKWNGTAWGTIGGLTYRYIAIGY